MLRCLFFICARHQFTIVAKHTPGKDNVAADAISRNNMQLFHSQVPHAASAPMPVPPLAGRSGTDQQSNRLALARLDQLVQFYFKQALAPATARSYETAKKRYLIFCESVQLPSVPASEAVLLRFVAALAAEGLASGTIKCYLSGVRHLQLSLGLGDPKVGNMATLQHVMRGIKSSQAKGGQQTRPRLPISPTILSGLRQVWEKLRHGFDNIMLWAACTTCFLASSDLGKLLLHLLTTSTPHTI